ncbi:RagB/SusD family nutrient uptake outer membrane protein [Niabella beijingensis]|uniref:RagB/SusD family nutrient uptake outer membrane protein n=1 Tax=Niabella beijingensis TaxID=2872700 RepID=UPI001CC1BD4A|nr:RagB/SusD family nutrient uptake outer membrane protein [Niabella beijingensis]MBZ4188309.1 RagB/SusD family nutrient uptake outer membrane protein [Niabella beijingensis]
MHIKNRRLRLAAMFLFLWALGSSCNKILDIKSSNLINESNAWSSINDARAGLLGTYGLLRTALAENEANWLYGELRYGPFVAMNRPDLDAIIHNNLKQSHDLLTKVSNWRKFYAVINSANLFIERSGEILQKDPQYTRLNNSVDVAQMKALIGLTYFYMVRIWGDVPLLTKSYDGTFPQIPRSEAKAVLKFAETQLKEAALVLPFVYGDVNADYFPGLYYGRSITTWAGALINRNAAYAILAHIAAWDNRYLDASVYADFVLNNAGRSGIQSSTTYDLTRSDGFFLNVNSNQVFALGMSSLNGEATPTGHIENLALANPLIPRANPAVYIPDSRIVQLFNQPGDERFFIDSNGVAHSYYFSKSSSDLIIFSKIKVIGSGGTQQNTAGENTNVLTRYSSPVIFTRLEEIKLLKAEALTVLGQGRDALDILNGLRTNRGIETTIETTDGLLEQIFAERTRELLGEAWAWYDYVRYQQIKNNDAAFNAIRQKGGIYWPVAREVLDQNPLLQQTEYWK